MNKKIVDQHSGSNKRKKLIKTQLETKRRNSIIAVAVVLVAVIVYILIDSRTYVASVAGNRIMTYEYKFLLRQQVNKTEQDVGISDKTDVEKSEYWSKIEGGQNPWETAKNETLNASKEYMLELIKAREMGLSIDNNVKKEVEQAILSFQSVKSISDADLNETILAWTGITLEQYKKILQNAKLRERFESEYVKRNYKAATFTEEQMKTTYDQEPKLFDVVDVRYILLAKKDSSGTDLTVQKKAKADEALKKIQAGGDVDKIIAEYTEETANAEQPDEPLGKMSFGFIEDPAIQPLIDFAFQHPVDDSGILETDDYVLVVKIDKRTGFEDAKADINTYLQQVDQQKWFMDELRNWGIDVKYNIIKNDLVYDSKQLSYEGFRLTVEPFNALQ